MNSNLSIFLPRIILWCYIGKNIIKPKVNQIFSYVISQKFYSFAFYIWVCDLFWVNFCENLVVCVWIHFSTCECPVVLAPFVKKTVFSSSNCLCFFVEDQLTLFVWIYFWALYLYSFLLFIYSLPVTHCLKYWSFIVLKLNSVSPLNFFVFSIVLSVLELLSFYINFRISLWIFTE